MLNLQLIVMRTAGIIVLFSLQSSLEHDSSVYCMSVAADGTLLATGTKDGGVFVWDLTEYYLLKHYRCKFLYPTCPYGYLLN